MSLCRTICVAVVLVFLSAGATLADDTNPLDWHEARLSGDVDLHETPFAEAARTIGSHVGSHPFVNWPMLEPKGITRETPVSLRLPRGTPAVLAMRLLVHRVSESTGHRLAVAFEEGTATISTRDDLAKNVQTLVIDARDLLPAEEGRQEVVNLLIGLIRAEVEPTAWRANGGTIAAITEINGQLVITATPEMLAGVQRLLAELRPTARDGDGE